MAVLFAPGVMGAAMAGPSHGRMQMMDGGHCQAPPSSSGEHKMTGKSCCIAMCMAFAVAPSTAAEASPLRQQMGQFAAPAAYHGLLADIATPPPRHA